MSIEKQKEVADKILNTLCLITDSCCLAGGAPAAWLCGREARDLDFFIKIVPSVAQLELIRLLLGVELKQLGKEDKEGLYEGGNIVSVSETTYFGEAVQFVIVDERCEDVVSGFPLSSSRALYRGRSTYLFKSFIDAALSKELRVVDGCGEKLLEKTKKKFPNLKPVVDLGGHDFILYCDKDIVKKIARCMVGFGGNT